MSSLDRYERATFLFRFFQFPNSPLTTPTLSPGAWIISDFNYLFLVKDLLSFLLAVHSFKPVRQTLAGPSARAFHVLATR